MSGARYKVSHNRKDIPLPADPHSEKSFDLPLLFG